MKQKRKPVLLKNLAIKFLNKDARGLSVLPKANAFSRYLLVQEGYTRDS